MIFEKILKTNNLDFEISLDNQVYNGGGIVRGILRIITNKDTKVRELRLVAEGVEKTSIQAGSSSSSETPSTYTETNIFFFKDLSRGPIPY